MIHKSLSQIQFFGAILSDVSDTENEEKPKHSTEIPENPSENDLLSDNLDAQSAETETDAEEDLPPPTLKELIHSGDAPSRYFTFLSIAFALLALTCFGLLAKSYLSYRAKLKSHENEKPIEAPVTPVITQAMGEYRVQWPKRELRVDLTAECSVQVTCDILKSEEVKIRDRVLPLLQASNPDAILNPEKKMALRRAIADELNTLPLQGKVLQIHFSDLTLERGPE